ncbi:RNA-binding cell elongation regulator Jag/EloR [Desulfovibrio sp. TomC]|uniref:RNA-binding cell elongation regulator Jag/EloR n=1 Tax=Desulfovibrio sp. TomC TaxID=1562888 RepID=UPI000575B3C5|nr:RNA-binding cell elongation regulator Jag/EloR [Desulfovibrio sp. TomC]KHK03373.1 RNA-binding protein Jag [Desulfovibrio sp. TomC]
MSEWKTFSGKTVDEAMEEACRNLDAPRDKLEIEILSGGSSGIFGLVGKKKAQVRARLREEINLLGDMPGGKDRRENNRRAPRQSEASRGEPAPRPAAQTQPKPEPARQQPPARPAETLAETPAEAAPALAEAPTPPAQASPKPAAPRQPAKPRQPAQQRQPAQSPQPARVQPEMDALADDEPFEDDYDDGTENDAPRASRDGRRAGPQAEPQPLTPELTAIVREVMEQMLDGILGQTPAFEITGHSERVSVLILDEENSGLLIGREGQTLAAIQYIVNRIVIRRHGNPLKVQINTGEYRERQDDNLRKMAIFLADKAKTLGRPQSTKPLSSYHRRVVHLALQEDEGISTRSKGEGPLKRVLILPRGARGESQSGQHAQN